MARTDLDLVLDWAADEGWNPGLEDADAFFGADPAGFFVADSDGEPVAAISVVNHNDDFAFLGLYLCRPDYRGKGIAYALWNEAIRHAGDRTIGLDGVPDQQDNYAKSGFVLTGATTRYSGRIDAARTERIRPAVDADEAHLVALEAAASAWAKPDFLHLWFRNSAHRTTIVIEDEAGSVTGMATVRRCRDGAKIGPLVASNEDDALSLLRHAASVFGDRLIVDVPSSSVQLERICTSQGMLPGFQTARMYRGPGRTSEAGLYAVATLELG